MPSDEPTEPAMEDVKRHTQHVYETRAVTWDGLRNRSLFERSWLERLVARTSPGDTILDVGCGAGEPIARYIMERDRLVCGVDFAEPMLAIARSRFPRARWVEADMRHLDLGESFAGLIAWDSFFHLGPDEQRSMLPRLARHVATGGCLLLTVGPSASEKIGSVGGEPIYHASLSIDEWRCSAAAPIRKLSLEPGMRMTLVATPATGSLCGGKLRSGPKRTSGLIQARGMSTGSRGPLSALTTTTPHACPPTAPRYPGRVMRITHDILCL
jgi:SAM-dependent methyltransferase